MCTVLFRARLCWHEIWLWSHCFHSAQWVSRCCFSPMYSVHLDSRDGRLEGERGEGGGSLAQWQKGTDSLVWKQTQLTRTSSSRMYYLVSVDLQSGDSSRAHWIAPPCLVTATSVKPLEICSQFRNSVSFISSRCGQKQTSHFKSESVDFVIWTVLTLCPWVGWKGNVQLTGVKTRTLLKGC